MFYTQPTISASTQMALGGEEKLRCPICLEPAPFMIAPRATKCGHLLCYGCLLQYLDYERENSWKKCPLCNEPIYKRDIRRATILFNTAEHESPASEEVKEEVIDFKLVIRCKANINAKHRVAAEESTESPQRQILEASLPSVNMEAYRAASRILVSDEAYIRKVVSDDLT